MASIRLSTIFHARYGLKGQSLLRAAYPTRTPFRLANRATAAYTTTASRQAISAGTTSSRNWSSIRQRGPDPQDFEAPHRFREFELDNRVFVITGGARGLGLTLAEALVEAGGEVHCLDRLPPPVKEFTECQNRLENHGWQGTLNYNHVDVSDCHAVDRVIAGIASYYSRLDGLIAAAGIQKVTPALEYPEDAITEMMNINYKGVYCSAVSCARQMIKYNTPGSLMLIGSMSGLIANKGLTSSVYNSSKAAVIQLARSLAMEWGQAVHGRPIRVNALCPGNIMTPMVRKNFADDPGLQAIWERENMLGRISDPSEYRGAALFLLSDASSFMTGSYLVMDGGYTAW